MPQVIKARYSKGVIEPLEKLDLIEGEIILISVEQTSNPDQQVDAFESAAGGWVGVVDTDSLLGDFKKNREGLSPGVAL